MEDHPPHQSAPLDLAPHKSPPLPPNSLDDGLFLHQRLIQDLHTQKARYHLTHRALSFGQLGHPHLLHAYLGQSPPVSPLSLEASTVAGFRATARPTLPRQSSFDQGGEGKLSSSQVRQKLKECVLNKKHREMSKSPPSWASPQNSFDSQDSPPAGAASNGGPSAQRTMRSYPLPGSSISLLQDDFPLRKTSSEPNLKVRSALKQKVIERRSSPLLKRRIKAALMEKQMNQLMSSANASEDGGSGSAPSPTAQPLHNGTSLPPHLVCPPQLLPPGSGDPLAFFTSMPNLNLPPGVPPFVPQNSPAMRGVNVTQADPNVLAGALLSFSNFSPYSSSVQDASGPSSSPPVGCSTPSGSRRGLPKRRQPRPLSRTHSAPLPLGMNPSLQLAVQEQKALVKAQLRQKVLHRTSTSSGGMDEGAVFPPSLTQIRVLSEDDPNSAAPHPPVSVYPRFVDRLGSNCLERTTSSPIMKLPSPIREETLSEFTYTTALAYDSGMLAHQCVCGEVDRHPENPRRMTAIWQRLQECHLTTRCHKITGKKATMDDLQLCHEDTYTVLYGTNPANRGKINQQLLMSLNFCRLPCAGVGVDTDTVWNASHTANASRLAAGCVSELALRVIKKDFTNGFAIVRPPGHHAEMQQAMGFCYFNSVAIAARKLLRHDPPLCRRILILDWDVHHGNGIQQIFYSDPDVLYLSLHRHDNGAFFPGTGAMEERGEGPGLGLNVNIAWAASEPLGDAEYMAAFQAVVMPICTEFAPDLVLVSAGFDAAPGHPPSLGGYSVSPACYAWMTQQVCQLAEGRVVLALEGGYELVSLCQSVEACIRVLLQMDDPSSTDPLIPTISPQERQRPPLPEAVHCLAQVIAIHSDRWLSLRSVDLTSLGHSLESGDKVAGAVEAMAGLSVHPSPAPPSEDADVKEEPMEAEEQVQEAIDS